MVTPAQSEKQATLLWLPYVDNAFAHKNKEFGISRNDLLHRLCNVRSSFRVLRSEAPPRTNLRCCDASVDWREDHR